MARMAGTFASESSVRRSLVAVAMRFRSRLASFSCRGAPYDEFKSRTISVVQKGSPAWVKRKCSESPFSR